MQTMPSENLDPWLRHIQADVFSRMAVIFRRCQYLVGFALQDSKELLDDADQSSDGGLFVSDIEFSRCVTDDEREEICDYIHETVAELTVERTEAVILLRGRTFARALH
jgi:hypothetical protein